MDINIKVINQRLYPTQPLPEIISGTSNFIRFVFELSGLWLGITCYAQFVQGANEFNIALDENNSVYLPEGITVGECQLTLTGSANSVIGTSNILTFNVTECSFVPNAQFV